MFRSIHTQTYTERERKKKREIHIDTLTHIHTERDRKREIERDTHNTTKQIRAHALAKDKETIKPTDSVVYCLTASIYNNIER